VYTRHLRLKQASNTDRNSQPEESLTLVFIQKPQKYFRDTVFSRPDHSTVVVQQRYIPVTAVERLTTDTIDGKRGPLLA
jgi:hypothetical protein